MGNGKYQYSTYGVNSNLLTAEISYPLNIEGEWTYIYISYKRIT